MVEDNGVLEDGGRWRMVNGGRWYKVVDDCEGRSRMVDNGKDDVVDDWTRWWMMLEGKSDNADGRR